MMTSQQEHCISQVCLLAEALEGSSLSGAICQQHPSRGDNASFFLRDDNKLIMSSLTDRWNSTVS
eukprot:scaffold2987_cov170-Amphora_coffeaeformis.AAC.28